MLIRKFCFCAFFVLSLASGEAKEVKQPIQFSFDDRQWEQGFTDSKGELLMTEYTPKGESIENWSELVTVQKFPALNITPDQFYQEFLKNLRATVSPVEVKTRMISQNHDSMLFEWWIEGNTPFAQHEWFRLFVRPDATLVLRYTTKKTADLDKVGETWTKLLNAATPHS